jgi:hypothetical protein
MVCCSKESKVELTGKKWGFRRSSICDAEKNFSKIGEMRINACTHSTLQKLQNKGRLRLFREGEMRLRIYDWITGRKSKSCEKGKRGV